jgi:hypothetical protein
LLPLMPCTVMREVNFMVVPWLSGSYVATIPAGTEGV